MPDLVQDRTGYTDFEVGVLSAIPYGFATAAMLIVARRGSGLVPLALVGAVGTVITAYAQSPVLLTVGITLAAVGILSTLPLFWALPTAFLSGTAAAAGIALIAAVGNLGGFVGPAFTGIAEDQTGSFKMPLVVLAGLLVVGCLLVLLLRDERPALAGAVVSAPPGSHAERLRALHRPGDPLLLVNAWDPPSARRLAQDGYPAIATTSAGVAEALGYEDGNVTPPDEMLGAVARIAAVVDVPVTADLEAGYGLEPRALVRGLLDAGAVGLNFEDTDHEAGALTDAELQAERLAAIKQAGRDAGSRRRPQRPRGRVPPRRRARRGRATRQALRAGRRGLRLSDRRARARRDPRPRRGGGGAGQHAGRCRRPRARRARRARRGPRELRLGADAHRHGRGRAGGGGLQR